VKYAAFGNSLGSKTMFHYLNIKSVFIWSIFGIGGWKDKYIRRYKPIHYLLIASKMFFTGDWKMLKSKISFHIKHIINNQIILRKIKIGAEANYGHNEKRP
jgi:hypothetical protein